MMLTSPEVLIKCGVDERVDSGVGVGEYCGEIVETVVPAGQLSQ